MKTKFASRLFYKYCKVQTAKSLSGGESLKTNRSDGQAKAVHNFLQEKETKTRSTQITREYMRRGGFSQQSHSHSPLVLGDPQRSSFATQNTKGRGWDRT